MSTDPTNVIPLGSSFAAPSLPVVPANANVPFSGSISTGTLDPDALNRDDPAVLIGLALRLGVMSRVRREGLPPSLREKLRFHAEAGEPACALILDWLDGLVLDDLEAAASVTSRPHR